MPRIDPAQLLRCLSVLLSSTGGIISKDEVNRVANLMAKFSKKLVSKCIYVSILKSTEVDILDMFMSAGGWDLVFSWLSDGINAMNWAFVKELVELLLICPVNIDRLKGNNCPKVIKLLSKNPSASEKVRELAEIVVEQWLAMVKEATSQPVTAAQGTADVTEQPADEDSNKTADEQSSIYKITIRDGPQVLAQVISDKTGPRVDTPQKTEEPTDSSLEVEVTGVKRPASSDDDEVVSPKKKVIAPVKESSEESETSDEEWNVKKKKAVGRKRAAPKSAVEKKAPAAPKKRKQKAEKIPVHKPEKAIKKKDEPVELIHPPSSKPVKKSMLNKLSLKSFKDEDMEDTTENREHADKDRETLAKLITPSISGIGRIPKKNRDSDEKDKKKEEPDKKKEEKKVVKKVEAPKPPPKPAPKNPSKYNYTPSVGKRDPTDRPKTVKTFNAKFRSTGLEEEAPLPPKAAKKVEKKEEVKSHVSSPNHDSSSPTHKKPEPLVSSKVGKEEEKHSEKATTPSKPKLMHLQESNMFGDALAAAYVPNIKKRKRRTSVSEIKKESEVIGKPTVESKDVKKEEKEPAKPKMKFYQDTLLTDDYEKLPDIKQEKEEEGSSSPVSQKEIEDELSKTEEAISNFVKQEEKKNVEREKCRLPQGILVYYKRKRIIKKSVVWKPGDSIQEIRYFELDETERVNVTKNFTDMKQLEKANEREHLLQSRRIAANDIMEEKALWRPPIPIDVPLQEFIIEPGKNSHEKEVQLQRERTVVPALYFHRKMIPDTPGEPDLEIHAHTDPVMIPLNDQTANPESVISYKDKGWPEPKENAPEPLLEAPVILPTGMPDMPMMNGPPPMPFPAGPMGPPGFFPPAAMPPMMGPGWVPGSDGPQPLFNGPPQDLMAMGAPPMMEPMPFPPSMPPNMPPNMGMPMTPGPNVNQGFMGGPQGPPMNFNQPNHFNEGPGPRPNRPWFRPNGPPNQWRHQNKGNAPWKGSKTKTCINIIKRGFCKTPHCAFKHPPPNTTYS